MAARACQADDELHVIIAAIHCFDKTVVQTVVADNVNPIEKVERSALIVATTIQNASAKDLVADSQQARIAGHSPLLFPREEGGNLIEMS